MAPVLSWPAAIWAYFWPVLAFCWLWLLWLIGAAAPILALLASLAFLPGSGRGFCFLPLRLSWPFALLSWAVRSGVALRWPSSLPVGLCVGLGFLPFCFGLCGLAWPSGGFLFVLLQWGWVFSCVGWLRCALGVWLVVALVVTSRDALLSRLDCYCFVANRAPLPSFL